jgi:hypothetical protein
LVSAHSQALCKALATKNLCFAYIKSEGNIGDILTKLLGKEALPYLTKTLLFGIPEVEKSKDELSMLLHLCLDLGIYSACSFALKQETLEL